MSEQLKHFLRLKAGLIGIIGLKMLVAQAFVFKLIAAKLLIVEGALIAGMSTLPVFAQMPIFATDGNGTVVEVQQGLDKPLELTEVQKFRLDKVSEKIKTHNSSTEDIANEVTVQNAVGKTSLSGKPMSDTEYQEYMNNRIVPGEHENGEEANEPGQSAVGKTSLAGIGGPAPVDGEDPDYDHLFEELDKIASEIIDKKAAE